MSRTRVKALSQETIDANARYEAYIPPYCIPFEMVFKRFPDFRGVFKWDHGLVSSVFLRGSTVAIVRNTWLTCNTYTCICLGSLMVIQVRRYPHKH